MKLNKIKLSNPYLQLPNICYKKVKPTPLNKSFLIHANKQLASILNIDIEELSSKSFEELLNGELLLDGADPFAMCYAGHQFGFYVDRLGDGRAINIGSISPYHLQLKGAGVTLYSRSGDGRAVLRSSLREYLMSEAMYGLGVETTRALGIVGSQHQVFRQDWESAAMVLRVSTSWVRFGTFEYLSHTKRHDELEKLINYSIDESYPHLTQEPDKYAHFFTEVMGKTARLMAKWQSIGFNHGVMNTDNMSIEGLTIDYGPYAFLDDYDINHICNHTDSNGRYSFGNQPSIGEWNLQALLVALSPIIDKDKMQSILSHYKRIYTEYIIYLMEQKLGLTGVNADTKELTAHLFGMMQGLSIDYTLFFRTLSRYNGDRDKLLRLGLYHKPMNDWLDEYDKKLQFSNLTQSQREEKMLQINPKFVLKNYMLQEAIDKAEEGDFHLVHVLFEIAQNPYEEHKDYERWSRETPDEFKNKKLSCSS